MPGPHDSPTRCTSPDVARLTGIAVLAGATIAAASIVGAKSAPAQLRIVSYNTATGESNGRPVSPRAGLELVLDAIGRELVEGIAKPIDVLALQEQSSSATTTQEIMDVLNAIQNFLCRALYVRIEMNGINDRYVVCFFSYDLQRTTNILKGLTKIFTSVAGY